MHEITKKRKSYTVEYKKAIVQQLEFSSISDIANENSINIRLVSKWKQEFKEEEDAQNYVHCRKIGSGRKPLLSELEDTIFEMVIDRRSFGFIVKRKDIKEFTTTLATNEGYDGFQSSNHWLSNFMSRFGLSLRHSTSLFKITDEEVINRTLNYKQFIEDTQFSNYHDSQVIFMDETAIYYGDSKQTTVDVVGSLSIYIALTGYESYRVTCILAIRRDCSKVTPTIITKGKKIGTYQLNGVDIVESEKAWATQEVIRNWIDGNLPGGFFNNSRHLLIWDSASTHRAKEMKEALSKRRVDSIMIPSGMTAYFQSLDIVINKSFKVFLRDEINNFVANRMERNARGNPVKHSLLEVISWVKNAWARITTDMIKNALIASYLYPSGTWKETAIMKHEKFGPSLIKNLSQPTIISNEFYPENDETLLVDE